MGPREGPRLCGLELSLRLGIEAGEKPSAEDQGLLGPSRRHPTDTPSQNAEHRQVSDPQPRLLRRSPASPVHGQSPQESGVPQTPHAGDRHPGTAWADMGCPVQGGRTAHTLTVSFSCDKKGSSWSKPVNSLSGCLSGRVFGHFLFSSNKG